MEIKEKIEIFISSRHGGEYTQYDNIRNNIKSKLEAIGLVSVYLFEKSNATSLNVEEEICYNLKKCDICIFLINNKDGISSGVQKEYNYVKNTNKQAIYFFCNENSDKSTDIQEELTSQGRNKYQNVKAFEEFEDCVISIFNNIIINYKMFCQNIMLDDEVRKLYIKKSIEIATKKELLTINSNTMNYFSEMFFRTKCNDKKNNSSEFDNLCVKILPIFFENEVVNKYNFEKLKSLIEQEYDDNYSKIITYRIDALYHYLRGDLLKSIETLNEILIEFKDNDKIEWIKNDILIDLRTLTNWYNEIENKGIYDLTYQNELDNRKFEFHYPIIDRFHADLYENIVKEDIKETIENPNVITFGNNLNQYTNLLAKSFMTGLLNGSIIHLNLTYSHVKNIAFAMLKKNDYFNFKLILLKTSLIHYRKNEIENIIRYFPELSYDLDSKDIVNLYYFMDNNPTTHIRLNAKLEVFKIYAYFLDDNDFNRIWKDLSKLINEVLEKKIALHYILSHIIETLRASFERISFNTIMEWVKIYFENNYSIAYDEIFKMFSFNSYTINKDKNKLNDLINFISNLIDNKSVQKNCHFEDLIINLCSIDASLIEKFDDLVRINMNEFYIKEYKEYSISKINIEELLESQIKIIENNNETQGLGGRYFETGTNPFESIIKVLNTNDVISDHTITSLIDNCIATAFNENQPIKAKTDAMSLMIVICCKYRYKYNDLQLLKKLENNIDSILYSCSLINHHEAVILEFNLALLKFQLGADNEVEIIEKITDINGNVQSIEIISKCIISYLQYCQEDNNILQVILQNAIVWSKDDTQDICINGCKILLSLVKYEKYSKLIMSQIDRLIRGNIAYIKKIILYGMCDFKNTNLDFYNEILEIASKDKNYIIRIIAEELKE